MGELPPWPKALEPWEPELRVFARELVGHLAALSERIAHAVGPLRVSTERRSDEPNGYSALSRRGPYERLLISEWALQLEHEDEFIRVLSVRLPAGETEKPRDNHPCILPNRVKNFQHKGLKNQKGTAEAMP